MKKIIVALVAILIATYAYSVHAGSGRPPIVPDVPEADCSWMVTEGYVYKSWNKNTDTGIMSHPYYDDFPVSCIQPNNPITPEAGMPAYRDGCQWNDYNGKAQVTRTYNPPPQPIYRLYAHTFLNNYRFHEPPPCTCEGHYCFVLVNGEYVCQFPLLGDGAWGTGDCGLINLRASHDDKAEVVCYYNGQVQSVDPNWVRTEMDIKCPSKKVSRLCNNPAGYCGIINCSTLDGENVCDVRITSTVCSQYCRGVIKMKDTPR